MADRGLRRLEIPKEMQKKFGNAPLGAADGPVKSAIFGGNNAKLYNIQSKRAMQELKGDRFAQMNRSTRKPESSRPTHATAMQRDRSQGVCVSRHSGARPWRESGTHTPQPELS